MRPALEPEPEGSLPVGTPADKVEVTVELFGIPLLPPPLPPLEWSGNLSRSQRTEPEKYIIVKKLLIVKIINLKIGVTFDLGKDL